MEEAVAAKGIYPNVDFYSATTYHSIGLPLDLFTPMFVVGRVGSWSGHVLEQLGDNRLFRPSAQYVGARTISGMCRLRSGKVARPSLAVVQREY